MKYLLAAVIAICAMLTSNKAHAEVVYEASVPTGRSIFLYQIEYDQEGWRNTRRLQTRFTIQTPGRPDFVAKREYVYYICGTRRVFEPTEITTVRDTDYFQYSGAAQGQMYLTIGGVDEFSEGRYFGAAKVVAADYRKVLSTLTRVCGAPPSITEPPPPIAAAVTTGTPETVFNIVPERFQRSGAVVSYWIEQQPLELLNLTANPVEPESAEDKPFTFPIKIESRREGRAMVRYEGNCTTMQSRTLISTNYRPDGTVVSSKDFDRTPASNPMRETVPGSVGEEALRVACLIQ